MPTNITAGLLHFTLETAKFINATNIPIASQSSFWSK